MNLDGLDLTSRFDRFANIYNLSCCVIVVVKNEQRFVLVVIVACISVFGQNIRRAVCHWLECWANLLGIF